MPWCSYYVYLHIYKIFKKQLWMCWSFNQKFDPNRAREPMHTSMRFHFLYCRICTYVHYLLTIINLISSTYICTFWICVIFARLKVKSLELRYWLGGCFLLFGPIFVQQMTIVKYPVRDIKKTKPRIYKFPNLKCCKMSFKAFEMKKQGLKCFFKVIIRNNTPLTRGFKRLSGLLAAL